MIPREGRSDLGFWEAGWVPRRLLDVFRVVDRDMGLEGGKKR